MDVLIGIDHVDLHYSLKDIKGKPDKAVARLTPLGWTCVGPTNGYLQTNFTQTYFVREQLERGERPSICNFSSLSLEQQASSLSACCTLS